MTKHHEILERNNLLWSNEGRARIVAMMAEVREAAIQECVDAITATGAELSTSINDSAVSGYYSSAEICRRLKANPV